MAEDKLPQPPRESIRPQAPEEKKPGTNEVQHQPDPGAEPMPGMTSGRKDGETRYRPSSPFTHGND